MGDSSQVDTLVNAYLDALRLGSAPDVEEYASAHPECSTVLRERLPGLAAQAVQEAEQAPPPPPPEAEFPGVGQLCGDYLLQREIGHGGMGVVYEAEQLSLGRKAAVKLLAPHLVNKEQKENFGEESRFIAKLHHPNIVKVYSAGIVDNACYYAMEYIDGGGLDRINSLTEEQVADIGLQAARALAYAHHCGVMHRDIKPSNLLLDKDGQIHISDFGLAFALQEHETIVERVDALSGTWRYMSPERREQGINTFYADQYALGASLYELLSHKPFPTEKATKRIPKIPCKDRQLAAVISKSLARNRARRYRSMDDFADDLQRAIDGYPVQAMKASALWRLKLWARRSPALAATTGAAILCSLGLVAALLVGYVRTKAALNLADKLANASDKALSLVFKHVQKMPPSQAGTSMLDDLVPYYREILGLQGVPEDKEVEALDFLGAYAMQAGDFKEAARIYRRRLADAKDAGTLNLLSECLTRQGRLDKADAISREVVDVYAASERPAERLEAAKALFSLARKADDPERSLAYGLVCGLLQENPDNPEYRFLYARILEATPGKFREPVVEGVEPSATTVLRDLVQQHPDRADFGIAYIDNMSRRLEQSIRLSHKEREEAEQVVNMTNRLLAYMASNRHVVSAILNLYTNYVSALRRSGDGMGARRENERLMGRLHILFYSPGVPASARELLISHQLELLQQAVSDRREHEVRRLRMEIRTEFEFYKGKKREELLARFRELGGS